MAENGTISKDYCPQGLLLPLMDESGWNRGLRATVYFLALLYAFVGVSVVTDVFMSAVVVITSKTRKIYLSKDKSKKVSYCVTIFFLCQGTSWPNFGNLQDSTPNTKHPSTRWSNAQ